CSNFQLEKFEMPRGRLVDADVPETVGAGAVWGDGGAGGAACAKAATVHRHATLERRKPLVTLRYTFEREESPQDITWQETLANGAGQQNRSGHTDGPVRGERGIDRCPDIVEGDD